MRVNQILIKILQNILSKLIGNSKNQNKWFPKVIIFSIVFFSFASLVVLAYQNKEKLLNFNWNINYGSILIGILFYTISILFAVAIWKKLMDFCDLRFSYWQNFSNYCISNLGKRIPGSFWYIPLRVRQYEKIYKNRNSIIYISLIEYVGIFLSSVIVSIFFAPSFYKKFPYILVIAIIFSLFLLAITINPKIKKKTLEFLKVIEPIKFEPSLLKIIFGYFILRIIGGISMFFIIDSIVNLPINYIFYIIGCWAILGLWNLFLFFSPTNWGLTELALTVLLTSIMPTSIAVFVSFYVRFFFIILEILFVMVIIGIININNALREKDIFRK